MSETSLSNAVSSADLPAAGSTSAAVQPGVPDASAGRRSRSPDDPLPPTIFSPEVAKTLDRLFKLATVLLTAFITLAILLAIGLALVEFLIRLREKSRWEP